MKFNSIPEAIEAYQAGKFIIVVDDEDRENEGDLIMAADHVTPEAIAFMVRHTSGIICISMKEERLNELNLPQMVSENTESHRTAFTVSVDTREGTTTGISASDRTKTIQTLIDPEAKPEDLARPGHIFPLRYREGGVLKRAGHTEAAVDLALLSDLYPAGILSEIVNEDGSMSRATNLQTFAKEHNLPIITIAELVRYRRRSENLVDHISEAQIPTDHGTFTAYVYESKLDGIQHIAFTMGDVQKTENLLVRVHSECLTGDVFNSRRCDCGAQLDLAMQKIAKEGCGVIVYLRGHEGRGIGLGHKIRAYDLQDKGRDTVEANIELGLPVDSREYGIGAQILSDLGATTIRLMTNNPIKYGGLEGYDLEIVERIPLLPEINKDNQEYLRTKKVKLGHFLEI